MVNCLHLCSAFINFWSLKAVLQPMKACIHSRTHSHANGRWLLYKVPTCSLEPHKHTFTHRWSNHQELFGFQYHAQGHFDVRTWGHKDRTTSLLISRRPILPSRCNCLLASMSELQSLKTRGWRCEPVWLELGIQDLGPDLLRPQIEILHCVCTLKYCMFCWCTFCKWSTKNNCATDNRCKHDVGGDV